MESEYLLKFIEICIDPDERESKIVGARNWLQKAYRRDFSKFVKSMISIIGSEESPQNARLESAYQIQRCFNDSHTCTLAAARQNWNKLSDDDKEDIKSKFVELFSKVEENNSELHEAVERCFILIPNVTQLKTSEFLYEVLKTPQTKNYIRFILIGYVTAIPGEIDDVEANWLLEILKEGLKPIEGMHSVDDHQQNLVALQTLKKWIIMPKGLELLQNTDLIKVPDLLNLIKSNEIGSAIIKLGFDCIYALIENNICDLPQIDLTSILATALVDIMRSKEENSCVEAVKFLYKICFDASEKISPQDLFEECLFDLQILQNKYPPMPSAKSEVDRFLNKFDESL